MVFHVCRVIFLSVSSDLYAYLGLTVGCTGNDYFTLATYWVSYYVIIASYLLNKMAKYSFLQGQFMLYSHGISSSLRDFCLT